MKVTHEITSPQSGEPVTWAYASFEQDKALVSMGKTYLKGTSHFIDYADCTWSGLLPSAIVTSDDQGVVIITWEGEVIRGRG